MAPLAQSADLFWTGAGTWDTTNLKWSTVTGGPYDEAIWNNSNLDTAVFQGTAGTVTLGAPVTVGGMTFNTANYQVTGNSTNTLTLAAGADIHSTVGTNNGNDPEISAVLAGTNGFTKTGTGWLGLNATSSSLSGDINIQAGTLYTRHEALGTGDIVFTGDSTLVKVYNANKSFTQDITINSNVSASMSAASFYYDVWHSGVLSGDDTTKLSLSMGGNSEIQFRNNANTFEGELSISGPGINVTAKAAEFNSLADSSKKISVNNGLFRLRNGGVSMNFANRQFEMLTGNAGLDNDSTNSNVTMSFSQNFRAAIGNNARTLTLAGVNAGNNTFGGAIANSATGSGVVNISKQEAGKWILSGDNSYTGTTTIGAGTLEIGGSGRLGNGSYAGNISIAATSSGNFKYNSSANQTLSGVISGAGALVKDGLGALSMTGTNTYSGATRINQGSLAVDGAGSINNSAVTIDGGTFRYNSSVAYTGALTFTSGAVGGTNLNGSLDNLTIGANQTITPGNSPGTATTGSQTWASGGTYAWEINSISGTAGGDPGWDLLSGTGNLDITAGLGSEFNLDIFSLTTENVAGALAGFDSSTSYSWLIADFALINGFNADAFIIDDSNFSNNNTIAGEFSLSLGGVGVVPGDDTQIYLTYTAIPEPNMPALIGVFGVLGMMRRRR